MPLKRKMGGEVPTYLSAWKQTALLYRLHRMEAKGERDMGEGQYGIQGQQIGRDGDSYKEIL